MEIKEDLSVARWEYYPQFALSVLLLNNALEQFIELRRVRPCFSPRWTCLWSHYGEKSNVLADYYDFIAAVTVPFGSRPEIGKETDQSFFLSFSAQILYTVIYGIKSVQMESDT